MASLAGGAALVAALSAGGTLYGAARIAPCDATELTASIGDSVPAGARLGSPDHRARRRRRLQRQRCAKSMPRACSKGRAATTLRRHDVRHRQGHRRRSCLRQSRDGGHRPQRPQRPRRREATRMLRSISGATRPRVKALIDLGFNLFSLANNHALRLRRARHRGDALSPRRRQHRARHCLCRHRQQFRRGDQARLPRPRRHARSASTPSASSPAIVRNFARPTRAPARHRIASGPTSTRS